eukprot:TRINITY_DN1918_c0_g1_i1.p1 TRINITY_DN1918_c0_g1~~TRINITY_DN1918_c0_g1_i1.p1  ORF type:complete len:796 (-),score=173.07 TRINITY_DN1918_c0_g1_i1:22-2409(-)
MSVVGIDFGAKNITIAVAQRGGIDIICNEVSNRKTPSMVGFDGPRRFIGEAGAVQYARNPQNTATNLQRIIGRKVNEQELIEEQHYLGTRIKDLEGGEVGVQVSYNGEQQLFSTTEVTGMMLAKIKEIIEKATLTKAKDVVISVPAYFTSRQRKALVDAASVAGLNCLRLLNDTTSSALAWGIYKEFSDTDPTYIMVYDIGDASTTVAVVAYTKAKLKVLAHTYDRTLGGRNFHHAIISHFIEQFKTKYKIDVSTSVRAKARLDQACEKVKTILSANAQAPINVDSLMEDRDVSGLVTREEFEKMCQPLFERIAAPALRALSESGIDASKLASIELVGGASRMPQVANILKATLGKEISRTLIAEEVVAKGCALQCAILSPVVRVKEFKVEDTVHYPVNLVWRNLSSDAMETEEPTLLFGKGTALPAWKGITFPTGKALEMHVAYSSPGDLPPGTDPSIGVWKVEDIPATQSGEPGKIRVKVRLDIHGILTVESAELLENVTEASAPAAAETATPPATPPVAAAAEGEKKEAEAPKVTTKRTPLTVVSTVPQGLTPSGIHSAAEAERKRITQDIDIYETSEKKNALEAYVYETRSALEYDLAPFMANDEREKFLSELANVADWLYGDGERADKNAYTSRLTDLRKVGDPAVKRKREAEERPHSLNNLKKAIEQYGAWADTTDAKYEHISKEDRDRVKARLKEAEAVFEKVEQSDKADKHIDPVIWSADIDQWKENLDKFVPPIMNKAKPAPAPAPAAKPAATATPAKEGEPMATEQTTPGTPTPASKPAAGMDVD